MRAAGAIALLALLAAASVGAHGVYPTLPATLAGPGAAVPQGWRQEIAARGDLNGDSRPDLALVLRGADPNLKGKDDQGLPVDRNPRLLAVYFARAAGGYRLVLQNHRLIPVVPAPDYDPLTGIAAGGVTIARGTLQVALGSFGTSINSATFTFRWQDKRFVLIGYDSTSASRTDNTVTTDSYNYLTARWKHAVERVEDDAPKVTWHDLPRRRPEALAEIGDGLEFDPLAPPPIPKADWTWADADISGLGDDPGLRATQKICARLHDLHPPASDIPGSGGGAPEGRCDSTALYYGIREPADPTRARACAFYEIDRPDLGDDPFAGIGMLMTIYANGRGAKRDLDLATALACRIYGAPAELEGRIEHLQAMKADPAEAKPFDYCDDITSGFAGAQCAGRAADIADAKRDARIAAITASWTKAERAGFAPLRRAAEAYAEASSDNEVDMSGTARGMFAIQRREAVLDAFAATLTRVAAGKLPQAGKADARAADAALNALYRKIMAISLAPGEVSGYQSADSLPSTTVTHAGIHTAERAWLAYRDAWRSFARHQFPAIAPTRLLAWLTKERIADLKPFADTE
ncbi:lysozyme inhibitor LprI family protein [Acidimangrovimonas sediminis]|uniref:lysozyme inhibitor LprI family protein n=1 Tax=Acidimangrovimonas sediminis TaxID=2056283 RepID=UPI000C80515F|nr:lysozyme inhibitor LprI family protein [Acidimangrovimonas sediminis]